jgi:hypothetical protein
LPPPIRSADLPFTGLRLLFIHTKTTIMKKKLFIVLAVLTICIFFISCTKTNMPGTGAGRLDKVVNYYPDGSPTDTTLYQYDVQNRLIGIVDVVYKNIASNTFEYNQQGRLVKYVYATYPSSGWNANYVYDNRGHIIKTNITSIGNIVTSNHSFAYDNLGRLITDTTFDAQTTNVTGYATYKYDNNSNITQVKHFFGTAVPTNPITVADSNTAYYQYDNKINPFYNISTPLVFSGIEPATSLSKNNVIAETPQFFTIDISYYNNGLPEIITTSPIGTKEDRNTVSVYFYK